MIDSDNHDNERDKKYNTTRIEQLYSVLEVGKNKVQVLTKRGRVMGGLVVSLG